MNRRTMKNALKLTAVLGMLLPQTTGSGLARALGSAASAGPIEPARQILSLQDRDEGVELVTGQIGGRLGPLVLDADGSQGYIGMGSGVAALDLSGERALILSRVELEAERIVDLAYSEQHVFVSIWPSYCCPRDTYAQLHAFDVSVPEQPRRVPFIATDRSRRLDFVSGYRSPEPIERDEATGRPRWLGAVLVVEADGVYLQGSGDGDSAAPATGIDGAAASSADPAEHFVLRPQVGLYRRGEPAVPLLRTTTGGRKMLLRGSRVLILQAPETPPTTHYPAEPTAFELAVVDVSDPSQPRVVHQIGGHSGAVDLASSPDGEVLYLARGHAGIRVLEDVEIAYRPLGGLDAPASSLVVDEASGRLYAAAATGSGLIVTAYALDDPRAPQLLAQRRIAALHDRVQLGLAEGELFLSTERGLSILRLEGDVLRTVEHLDLPGGVRQVAVDGPRIWAASGDRLRSLYRARRLGLVELAESEPLHGMPTTFRYSQAESVLRLDGGLVLVSDGYGRTAPSRLHLLDSSDPWSPRRIASIAGRPGHAHTLARSGDTVWMLDGLAGLFAMPVEALEAVARDG